MSEWVMINRWLPILLLIFSNVFMTFAWAHRGQSSSSAAGNYSELGIAF
jgi:uncharacterized protein (DUF486 family)